MSENFKDPGLNSVMLTGRIVADPDLRYLPSGTACSKFAIAVNHRVKDGDDWKDEVSFFDVVTWEKLAETCSEKLYKSCPVMVEGKLKQERWEKDGNARSKIVIKAWKVTPMEWQKSREDRAAAGESRQNVQEEKLAF